MLSIWWGKVPDEKITSNGPKLHEYIKEMTAHTFVRDNLISVGETWSATPEIAKLYSNPDGSELSMVFQFEHICLDQQEGKEKWDLAPLPFHKFKEVWNKWQTELYGCGWNSLFGIIMIFRESFHDGEMRVSTERNLRKCWQHFFTECRELRTFTRGKNWV